MNLHHGLELATQMSREQIRQALLHLPTTFTQALIAGGGLKILLVGSAAIKGSDGIYRSETAHEAFMARGETPKNPEPTPEPTPDNSARTNPSGFNRTTENDSPDPRSYPSGNTTGYQRSHFDNPNVVSQPTGGGGFWGFLNGRGRTQEQIDRKRRDKQRHEDNYQDAFAGEIEVTTDVDSLGAGGVQFMDNSPASSSSLEQDRAWLEANDGGGYGHASRETIDKAISKLKK